MQLVMRGLVFQTELGIRHDIVGAPKARPQSRGLRPTLTTNRSAIRRPERFPRALASSNSHLEISQFDPTGLAASCSLRSTLERRHPHSFWTPERTLVVRCEVLASITEVYANTMPHLGAGDLTRSH